ncbi:YbaB/EbfC family nucleoid-associated protein [Amycolatopsis sp. GM8]|uniref:YbaB/EbfC family nucleoid-associated protein n=1 Tax=Amycolatopsis sp. GM8 TaxID=2896530 RepID=UPI001F3DA182|nr:YbaB/EbfC family nucleoid-associated protein [Amycolatopsis sp. GM8]
MADLSDVERMVDDWERDAKQKAERYQRMQQEVGQISITGSAAHGAVSVTVGSNGIPTGVAMTDAVRKMNPDEIAAAVLTAMQQAQSQYPQRIQEIVSETVGDDDTSRHIVATAVENFPPPPPAEEEPEAPGRQLRIEQEAEEEQPAQPKPQPKHRREDGGDDDFGDQTFLRRD